MQSHPHSNAFMKFLSARPNVDNGFIRLQLTMATLVNGWMTQVRHQSFNNNRKSEYGYKASGIAYVWNGTSCQYHATEKCTTSYTYIENGRIQGDGYRCIRSEWRITSYSVTRLNAVNINPQQTQWMSEPYMLTAESFMVINMDASPIGIKNKKNFGRFP